MHSQFTKMQDSFRSLPVILHFLHTPHNQCTMYDTQSTGTIGYAKTVKQQHYMSKSLCSCSSNKIQVLVITLFWTRDVKSSLRPRLRARKPGLGLGLGTASLGLDLVPSGLGLVHKSQLLRTYKHAHSFCITDCTLGLNLVPSGLGLVSSWPR